MSDDTGVIRIGKKGMKKFAFGEEGVPFELDVVVTWQEWIEVDEKFRGEDRLIPLERMPEYHQTTLGFAIKCAGMAAEPKSMPTSIAEALDFLARLREQYNGLLHFFRSSSQDEQDSPDTSEVEHRFSEEPTEK